MILTLRREESFESGQHALSDEFAYVVEAAVSLGDTRNIPAKIYCELHGAMRFELVLKSDRSSYNKACVRSLDFQNACTFLRSDLGKVQDGSTTVRRNPPVLGEVTYLVEPPKRVSFIV